jgi:hypothetical protein
VRDSKSERVQRWKNEIQQYDFDIEHIDGIRNIPADAFSRLINLENNELNDDVISAISDISIPRDKYKLISHCHNSFVGHHGVDRTINKLKHYLTTHKISVWTQMRQHVMNYIKKCPLCQKLSVIKSPLHAIKYTLSTYNPMQRICIDTINMTTPDSNGNTSIIVIIDCFSRWVELFRCY